MNWMLRRAAGAYALGWEIRRGWYARGWARPSRVPARVVSIGNLTVGGTGKTTLVLHLAGRARALGTRVAVVCRRYRPGPQGMGDEELLYRSALGVDAVFAGRRKRTLAMAAAAAGAELVLVDDGFSHWRLARDMDVVLVDAQDPWGGGSLLPAGRLREPRRALQRADVLVVSRCERDCEDVLAEVRPYAPAALLASGRHRPVGVRALDGSERPCPPRVHVVTATGHPRAVARTAVVMGHEVAALRPYRDHHWFSAGEARGERTRAASAGAAVLLTRKDAVRWPAEAGAADVFVLDVAWEWLDGGESIERFLFRGEVGT